MKRAALLFAAVAAMIALAALANRRAGSGLLVLEWAGKADFKKPPVAVLIEMGLHDYRPVDWSARARVQGAKIVSREGYRFRTEDKLTAGGGWRASSHRGLRVPSFSPQISKMEGIATVGVVLHLANVKDDAKLVIEPMDPERGKVEVPLQQVLSGQRVPLWKGQAVVRLVSTTKAITAGPTEDDYAAAAYGPDGTLWVAYTSYTLRDPDRRIEQHDYKEQPRSFKNLYHPELAEQLFLKSLRGGKWSGPSAITGPNESIARCAVAVAADGTAWVTYSAYRKGTHDIYARPVGGPTGTNPEQRLTDGEGSFVHPVMCTDRQGRPWVAYQWWKKDGNAVIATQVLRDGKWQAAAQEATDPKQRLHSWHPSLAAGPRGEVVAAHDLYAAASDYDIDLLPCEGDKTPRGKVAATARFEARPSACYDPQGRLWIAYEEGPERWGQDSGALVRNGNPLYSERSVRVVCIQDGKLMRPAAELPTSKVGNPGGQLDAEVVFRQETGTRYAYPQIGLDGKGRVWLTYRQNFGSRYTTNAGSYWVTFARRLDGDHWSEPIEVHHSDALLDCRPVLLPHKAGGLLVIQNSDGRNTEPETVHNHIFMSYLDLPGEQVEPKLLAHEPGEKAKNGLAIRQAEAVKRSRAYRIENGGKTYRLLAGEFHRHTEISWDGGADGSLEDMWRYALDAASLDWIGNTDHDNGAGREYSWWLTQKWTDAYHVAGAFTPVFSYERSVSYPHGHRNCIFTKRGVMTLPRLAAPSPDKAVAGISPDDTKMLYRYLRELDGICASHTSTTGMGTDWRDNDPELEPVVEIYQGDRMSQEYPDAPRAGHDPEGGEKPANLGGWHPDGFISVALQKGYRLGFQSSSDHWSTHISYCMVLAESHDRQGIAKALRQRHCYGATDHIILEVRSGPHLMGDEFQAAEAPSLQIAVIGTAKLAKVDILRDSEVVATLRPAGNEFRGKWTDPVPRAGTHYYYVRVMQHDGELAWGSPMWITRK
jgi:hypothetical protein